jgi:hypothetical protein
VLFILLKKRTFSDIFGHSAAACAGFVQVQLPAALCGSPGGASAGSGHSRKEGGVMPCGARSIHERRALLQVMHSTEKLNILRIQAVSPTTERKYVIEMQVGCSFADVATSSVAFQNDLPYLLRDITCRMTVIQSR